VTKPICPECGRTWIDTKIGEELPALTPEVVAASAEKRQAAAAVDLAPPPDDPPRRPWGLLVGALIGIGIVLAVFNFVLDGDGDDSAAASTTTTPATTASTAATTTSVATTTTSTTVAPTTTTSTTTTTTTTTTTLPPIEPEGTAVPVADLDMGAFGLGPFGFNAATSYLGRLVASLGQPDSSAPAGTEMGLCDGEEGVTYTWDGFTAIFRIEGDLEVFVGYRLLQTGSDHPTQQLSSRSGLVVGDTVEQLDAIYLQSGLAFEDIDGKQHFLLLRSSDAATLLWGPVTDSSGSGIVEGIYSPRACDGGPVATP
jgi:hypothetical protein